ncbi:hypothetical protein [Geomonas subterranea]|uniref:hypothetical protein n=1 Tax=Geomonas subterranea TaxID=2847989 RepID=UPI001CD1FD41|nr:hypothetical protein [Geomonas fuzhouensis]
MKSWTYAELTKKAEKQILRLMKTAAEAKDSDEEKLYREWAYGVFLGWSDLTFGWIQDGDLERLENLTKGEGEG